MKLLMPKLLIPGPVTTHRAVRAALAHDFAPWDTDFLPLYHGLGARLLRAGGGQVGTHVALTLPGCGHFVIEAAIRSLLPPGGRLLVPMTGVYAERMARLAREAGRVVVPLPVGPGAGVEPAAVRRALLADPGLTHVGLIYSETGSGVVHDPAAVGAEVRALGRRMIVDAVSAFGALPIDLAAQPEIDAVVFPANKCLEGVPGVAFALARRDRLAPAAPPATGRASRPPGRCSPRWRWRASGWTRRAGRRRDWCGIVPICACCMRGCAGLASRRCLGPRCRGRSW